MAIVPVSRLSYLHMCIPGTQALPLAQRGIFFSLGSFIKTLVAHYCLTGAWNP